MVSTLTSGPQVEPNTKLNHLHQKKAHVRAQLADMENIFDVKNKKAPEKVQDFCIKLRKEIKEVNKSIEALENTSKRPQGSVEPARMPSPPLRMSEEYDLLIAAKKQKWGRNDFWVLSKLYFGTPYEILSKGRKKRISQLGNREESMYYFAKYNRQCMNFFLAKEKLDEEIRFKKRGNFISSYAGKLKKLDSELKEYEKKLSDVFGLEIEHDDVLKQHYFPAEFLLPQEMRYKIKNMIDSAQAKEGCCPPSQSTSWYARLHKMDDELANFYNLCDKTSFLERTKTVSNQKEYLTKQNKLLEDLCVSGKSWLEKPVRKAPKEKNKKTISDQASVPQAGHNVSMIEKKNSDEELNNNSFLNERSVELPEEKIPSDSLEDPKGVKVLLFYPSEDPTAPESSEDLSEINKRNAIGQKPVPQSHSKQNVLNRIEPAIVSLTFGKTTYEFKTRLSLPVLKQKMDLEFESGTKGQPSRSAVIHFQKHQEELAEFGVETMEDYINQAMELSMHYRAYVVEPLLSTEKYQRVYIVQVGREVVKFTKYFSSEDDFGNFLFPPRETHKIVTYYKKSSR